MEKTQETLKPLPHLPIKTYTTRIKKPLKFPLNKS